MANETVPTEVAAHIPGIVKGQYQTGLQLNNINKCLEEVEKQSELDVKALTDALTKLSKFNDALSQINNQFDEMNRSTNTHYETQGKMDSLMNDVTAAQKMTCDLYSQIREEAKKQKIPLEECIQESYLGTIKLLEKQQNLGQIFNQICDSLEKHKETIDVLLISFKQALDAFPVALHKIYGK